MSEQHNGDGQDLIGPEDVQRIYGIPVGTQATWRSQGRYGFDRFVTKLGASVRYRRRELDLWIQEGGAKEALGPKLEAPVAEALRALRSHDVQAADVEASAAQAHSSLARVKTAIAAADTIDKELDARVATHQSCCVDFFQGKATRADVDRSSAELAVAAEAAEIIRQKGHEARGALETVQSAAEAASRCRAESDVRRDDLVYVLRRALAVQCMHEAQDQFDSAYESYCLAHVAAQFADELVNHDFYKPNERTGRTPVAQQIVPCGFRIGTTVANWSDNRWGPFGLIDYLPTPELLAAAKEALKKRVAEVMRSPIAESTDGERSPVQPLPDELKAIERRRSSESNYA